MEPPLSHMRMLWEQWLDGRIVRIEYETRSEMLSFRSELFTKVRKAKKFVRFENSHDMKRGLLNFQVYEGRGQRCEAMGCQKIGTIHSHWWD